MHRYAGKFRKRDRETESNLKKWKEIAEELAIIYGAGGKRREARTVVVRKKNFPKSRRENMTTDGFYAVYCYKRGDETGSGCL